MTNQPNKATVKDGLSTAKEIIDKHALKLFPETYTGEISSCIIDAIQEYSDQQNAELLAWKESAMRELNALDLQSLGRKLGIGLGQSVSENIHAKVDSLLERVRELEEALMPIANTHDVAIEIDPKGIAYKMRNAAAKGLKKDEQ